MAALGYMPHWVGERILLLWLVHVCNRGCRSVIGSTHHVAEKEKSGSTKWTDAVTPQDWVENNESEFTAGVRRCGIKTSIPTVAETLPAVRQEYIGQRSKISLV